MISRQRVLVHPERRREFGGPLNVTRALLATAFLLLFVPLGAAEGEWQDPAGDHEVGHTAYSQFDDASYTWTPGGSTGWYPVVDLRKVSITEEAPETITFAVETAANKLAGNEPHPVDYVRFIFDFQFHGQSRSMVILWSLQEERAAATLRTMADNRSRLDETFLAVPLDDVPGWKVEIPKFKFRDAEKIPLRRGDVLETITFTASTALRSTVSPCFMREETPPYCWKGRDNVMGGATLGDYTVERSPSGVGHLELTSPTPLRSSNGLATTYIFELTLHNLGAEPDAAFITVGTYPTEWTISSPAYIQVGPRAKAVFPVAVSVPFTHLHGNETFVDIGATSERDPGIKATQQIGVVWTKIPQPSGHHPDLYLHAGAANEGWINTLLEDEEAVPGGKIRHGSSYASFGQDEKYRFQFWIQLSPGLESGLDFDRGDDIMVKLPLEFHATVKPSIRTTFLVYNQGKTVAEIGSTLHQGNDVSAGSANLYQFSVPVNESGERIPHNEDDNLVMLVEVSYTIPGGAPLESLTNPQEEHQPPLILTQDTYVRLPLVEYIDVVDETLLASLTKFSVTAVTDTYKLVNPGRIASFGVQIDNRGEGDTLEWKLVGANPEWATIYPKALNVPGGGNATVVIDVLGPELASEGENMNALLIGQSRNDPNSQVLVRLVAQVTHSQDVPDETPLSQRLRGIASENDAGVPGPAFWTLIATVALAVFLRRR